MLTILYNNIMVFVWSNTKLFCLKNHVFCYLFLLPCIPFASSKPSLLKYSLFLNFLDATFSTFFSVFGAITVLCGTINTLLSLYVVPSVNVTEFPLADCTTCTLSLQLLSVPFLNYDITSTPTLSILLCFHYI
jgi:hypothetical protein